MTTPTPRRRFMVQTLGAAASVATASVWPAPLLAQGPVARVRGTALRLGLNAYSFNEPLRAGTMTLDDLVDFCAEQGFDGLDATGYYFPVIRSCPTTSSCTRSSAARSSTA